MSLALIVPTRGRPDSAVRLAGAVARTADPAFTSLLFVIDRDDPQRDAYAGSLGRQAPWAQLHVVPADGPRRMGPVLNWAAVRACRDFSYLGFMGDDHLPHTGGWDRRLAGALGGKPGVAYGNDLFQGEKLPTACVLSADIVRVLGYMSPPPLEHLYIDDFWKVLGAATQLRYLPDVIIEHLHPAAGKAGTDEGYVMSMGAPQAFADQARFEDFCRGPWAQDRKRLRKELGLD